MQWGLGTSISASLKQKLNTRSSTESELVGVDDMMEKVLWIKLFLEEQGVHVEKNIVMQDNQSAIRLEENGRASAGKRTRALNIRYCFITDQVQKGNLSVKYLPSEEMVADFLTKPLQGELFCKFQARILRIESEKL